VVCLEGSHPRGIYVMYVCIYIYTYTYQSLSFLASQVWKSLAGICQVTDVRSHSGSDKLEQQTAATRRASTPTVFHWPTFHSPAPAARNGSCAAMAMRKPRLEYHPAWSQTLTEITWELEAAEFSQLMSDFLIHQQLSESLNC